MRPTATTGSKEQRRHHRVVPMSHEPVEVQIMGGAFLEVVTANDISIGGVGICVPHGFSPQELSEQVQLVLTLPGKKSFIVRGVMRHLTIKGESGQFGVEFLDLDTAHRGVIEDYIERLMALGRRS